jgi:hypothetical protein
MYGIQEILHRRTDLSTFLVHLTRGHDGVSAKKRLEDIDEDRELIAGSPMGWADKQDDRNNETRRSQRVVCFSETPLEHSWALAAEIDGRQVPLEGYGVALPKYRARQLGVNPVWYVEMTPGRDWKIADSLNKPRDEAIATGDFLHQPAARLFPFVEPMGVWPDRTREFWWEREWRHVGTLNFRQSGASFLCPEEEIEDFVPRRTRPNGTPEPHANWNRRKREFVDSKWGLERIIAHLAGMSRKDVTPFDT